MPVVAPGLRLRLQLDAPLAKVARHASIPAGQAGGWPLLQGSYAFDTRLAMIENAHRALDGSTT